MVRLTGVVSRQGPSQQDAPHGRVRRAVGQRRRRALMLRETDDPHVSSHGRIVVRASSQPSFEAPHVVGGPVETGRELLGGPLRGTLGDEQELDRLHNATQLVITLLLLRAVVVVMGVSPREETPS